MAVATQTTPKQQLRRARDEGWAYDGSMATEGEILHLLTALVHITKPDICVETGTFSGHGTKAIQAGLMANARGHLWTVEHDEHDYPELERTTFVQADSIGWSRDEAPQNINFCFVDCAERPEDRVQVFSNLLPKMASGGLICTHDVAFYRAEDYLDKLCDAIGRPPAILFPALNGIAIWIAE